MDQSVEFRIALPGLDIAGTRWGDADAPHKVLCLHGWLDGAATFSPLAAALLAASRAPLCIVAIDLPGHGQSGHYASSSYSFLNYAATIVRVLEALQWRRPPAPLTGSASTAAAVSSSASKPRSAHAKPFKPQPPLYARISTPRTADSQLHVIAHSMGGAIALLTAGLLAGDREIDSLCLLDAFFGWGSDGDDFVAAFHAVHQGERRAHAAAAATTTAINSALVTLPPPSSSLSLPSALNTPAAATAVIRHPAVFASIDAAAQARQRDAIAASLPRGANASTKGTNTQSKSQSPSAAQQPQLPEPDNAVLSLAAARLCVQRSLRPLAASLPTSALSRASSSTTAAASSGFVFAFDPNLMAMTYRLTPLGIADALLARADAATPRIVLVRASVQRPPADRAAVALAARQTALLRNTHANARVADAVVTVVGAHHVHVQHPERVVAHALRAMGLADDGAAAATATVSNGAAATAPVAKL